MFRYILYAFMLVIARTSYDAVENASYDLYNREILYNKWEHFDSNPNKHLRGNYLKEAI